MLEPLAELQEEFKSCPDDGRRWQTHRSLQGQQDFVTPPLCSSGNSELLADIFPIQKWIMLSCSLWSNKDTIRESGLLQGC